MTKSMLLAQYFRDQAWCRLDGAGPNALRVARNVVSLLDAAAYLSGVPDDLPAIAALDAAGCFGRGAFEPGTEGAVIVRDWQLADRQSAGPQDLMSALAAAAGRTPPDGRVHVVIPAQLPARQSTAAN